MARETHIRWNTIASLITLAVLLVAGGKVRAFLQSGGEPAGRPLAISQQAAPATEQEASSAENAAEGEAEEHGFWDEVFHWANFLLIAGGVWYLGKKFGAPFLSQRARGIQEDYNPFQTLLAALSGDQPSAGASKQSGSHPALHKSRL